MTKSLVNRVSSLALVLSVLLVAVGLLGSAIFSDRTALASNGQAVTSLVLESDSSVGTVGRTRQKITVIAVRDVETISESLTLTLSVTPLGSAHLFPSSQGVSILPESSVVIGPDEDEAEFYVEWLEAGEITISASADSDPPMIESIVFTIEPAVDTSVPAGDDDTGVDTSVPAGEDDTGVDTSVPAGEDDTGVDTSVPAGDDDTGVDTSVPGGDDDTGVDTSVPGGDDDTGVDTGSGLGSIDDPDIGDNSAAEERTIKLITSLPESAPYFSFDRIITDLKVEIESIDGAEFENNEDVMVEFHVSQGGKKLSVWVLGPEGQNGSPTVLIPAGSKSATVSLKSPIDLSAKSVNLCTVFSGDPIDKCGIEVPVQQQELTIRSVPGGATIGWDRKPTTTYEISLIADPLTEFTATVTNAGEVRTTSLTESFNGVAKHVVTPDCAPDKQPNCELRIWFDHSVRETLDQRFTIEVRIIDQKLETSDLFAAGKIELFGDPTPPGDLTVEVTPSKSDESAWIVKIIPSDEDGGVDQSLQIRYRTSNSIDWKSASVPFDVWKHVTRPGSDDSVVISWDEFELGPEDELEEVIVTPFNSVGPGNPQTATFPPLSMMERFTGGGWILILSVSLGSILFVAVAWQYWVFAQSKNRDAWFKALVRDGDRGETKEARAALLNYVNNPSNAEIRDKTQAGAIFIDGAFKLLAAQKGRQDGLGTGALSSIARFINEYGDSQTGDIVARQAELIDIKNATGSAHQERRGAEQQLETTREMLANVSAEKETVTSQLNESKDELSNVNSEVSKLSQTYEQQIKDLGSRFGKARTKLDNELKALQQRANASKAERAKIESDGFEDLVDAAMSAVSSDSTLEALSEGGRVRQKADLNELVKRLSELQDDGIVFATSTRPGDFTMTHPAVNDLARMRKLIRDSITAFGAWMISSTKIEAEVEESPSFDPTKKERTAELKDLDQEYGVVGFGLASGLERIFDLAAARLSEQSSSDERIRHHDQAEFLEGAAQAVETLLSSNLNVTYPEFYESLGLEEGEIEGLRVGADDRGPADALAIYVINDWFSQLSDDGVRSQARTTMAEVQRLQNDQQLTAYGFKNVVMANLQTRWSFSEDEDWSPSTISGFSVICDYIVRYIHADSRSSWS